ncbi:MAG TPA: DUF6653 family protein, partial [Propionibacteriaceae bacterium]|nr:DUF6653 family protein [Propionibacteriaceae bacterium]
MDQCSTGTTSHQHYQPPHQPSGHALVIDLRPRARGLWSAHRQPARTTACRKACYCSPIRLFGLKGEGWLRHANPISVWTRFAVLPMLALSIWSRTWIGLWSLVPIALSLVFMIINPVLFPKPRSTKNWASKGVFGERIWADRTKVELP